MWYSLDRLRSGSLSSSHRVHTRKVVFLHQGSNVGVVELTSPRIEVFTPESVIDWDPLIEGPPCRSFMNDVVTPLLTINNTVSYHLVVVVKVDVVYVVGRGPIPVSVELEVLNQRSIQPHRNLVLNEVVIV